MSSVEEVESIINHAKRFHRVDVRVVSIGGVLSISALRRDKDRFYVAKRHNVHIDKIVDEVRSVVDEISAEWTLWKLGQP